MSNSSKHNNGLFVESENTECANLAYSAHRRFKCNSGKEVNRPQVKDSYCSKNESSLVQEMVYCTSSCRTSPLHRNSYSIKEHDSSNQRASLEKDIEQLQLHLQQEKCVRMVLEKAMGRASSTLSPGHRHFSAETKQLIDEIELLEEEVANREQQVLSLYRNVFEHCVSRPASEQSSVATSPAHERRESRKHPGIISTSFCSSFPLRRFNSLTSVNIDSQKRNLSKTRHASSLNGKRNMDIEKSCVNHVKAPTISSVPTRTLKDHLYECPSKLAAEMVRCMAAVYCWLRTSSSSHKTAQGLSTKVILHQWKVVKEDKVRSTKSTVEIPWISTEKAKFSRASYAITSYRILVEQLENVNVRKMEANAQIAFWINLYNSLIMHAYLAFGIPHSSLRRLALFHKAAYNVGGLVVNANAIEQSIFGYRTPRIGQWFEMVLSTAIKKRSAEERKLIRSNYGLKNFQPLVSFAICTGAYSDPVLNVYTAQNIREELEAAKRLFLESNVFAMKMKNIYLPKLIEKYAKEACIHVDDILDLVLENVDEKFQDSIQRCRESRPKKKIIKWLPYDSRFRYVLSKELTENPWRV